MFTKNHVCFAIKNIVYSRFLIRNIVYYYKVLKMRYYWLKYNNSHGR